MKALAVVLVSVLSLLAACEPISHSPTQTVPSTANEVTNQCQAFAIARGTLSTELATGIGGALCDDDISRGDHGIWFVEFPVDNVTSEQTGWQRGPNVEFGPASTYNLLEVDIDALSGRVLQEKASNGFLLGGPDQWITSMECGSARTDQQFVVTSVGPIPPYNPGGPVIQITLKNLTGQTIVGLGAVLRLNTLVTFEFPVSASAPLLPNHSISVKTTAIGANLTNDDVYPLGIWGNFSGAALGFKYLQQVMILPSASR